MSNACLMTMFLSLLWIFYFEINIWCVSCSLFILFCLCTIDRLIYVKHFVFKSTHVFLCVYDVYHLEPHLFFQNSMNK